MSAAAAAAAVYNRKPPPREFNFPPLKAYTKTTRHVISYGSSHSSQFGGYKLDDKNSKTVFWPTTSTKIYTEENGTTTRPRQKSHTPSQKAPSSKGAEQDDRCPLHADATLKKQKSRRSIKQLKRKHSTSKRKSKEANGEKCKKAVKAYVPITAPKSVSVPIDGQSITVGTQTMPVPSPSPYKAKSASLMPNRSSQPHFQTTLWKEGSCWPKASPEVGSAHSNATSASYDPVLRDKADRQHRQSSIGRCEAVEILDKTIDSLTVADNNVMDSVENVYDGRSSKASSGATHGSRSFPRPIDRFPPQPKQIRNFTFRTLTRPQVAVVGSSVSGLIADRKYSALRGLLQSRGALPKAPAPSASSYHRSLSNRDDDVTSSVSYNFRYQKRQQEQFQRARTWTESVTCSESVWPNEWQTVSSLVSSMPSRMSDGTYHDVTSIVDLPDIVATRTESRAATRGSVMSSRDALHLSVELEEDVNDVFSEGEGPALSAASYPQPWDQADDASLHLPEGELGQTELDNGINQGSPATSEKQLRPKPKTPLQLDTLLSYSGEGFERYKSSVGDDFANSIPPEQCCENEQNNQEDIDDEVFLGTHIYHDPRVECSIDMLNRNKVARSTRPKSILKSKSAKVERNVRKDVSLDADEDSQHGGRRPEFGRSYTAVCMGTSSFEPINRRYSTRSSQSQRNKVMFAADDYVGYQHKKFSKAVNSKQVTPDRNYDEKTKEEFLNVKIGETPDPADSQLSQESSDYLSDSYDSG